MSGLYIGDITQAQFSNQIAASFNNVTDVILEQAGRIFCITNIASSQFSSTGSSSVNAVFINLRGEEQRFVFRYWTGRYTFYLPLTICGRKITLNNITGYHGFYLLSTGGEL